MWSGWLPSPTKWLQYPMSRIVKRSRSSRMREKAARSPASGDVRAP
jgi:hypothetical protein